MKRLGLLSLLGLSSIGLTAYYAEVAGHTSTSAPVERPMKSVRISINPLNLSHGYSVSTQFPVKEDAALVQSINWNGYGFSAQNERGANFLTYKPGLDLYQGDSATFFLKKYVDKAYRMRFDSIGFFQTITVHRGVPAQF